MRIFILTQSDNLYLPNAMAAVCRRFRSDIVCIVSAPSLSGKHGPFKDLLQHIALFGLRGSAQMALRVFRTKLRNRFSSQDAAGPFYSLQSMAAAFDVPFFEVGLLRAPEFQELLDRYPADLLVSMSCPQIINKKTRARFPRGCINVHGSPLPRYRGLMPAFWVLHNNETETASTVHDLAEKLDDGDILAQKQVTIAPDETWDSLVRKTKAAGSGALIDVVEQIMHGMVDRKPNREEQASYYSFPTRHDGKAFRAAGRRFF